MKCLAGGSRTEAELNRELKLGKGGRVSSVLSLLEEAGLVSPDPCVNPETGRPMREQRHRLSDNYTRFYLKYIEPLKAIIDDGSFDMARPLPFLPRASLISLKKTIFTINLPQNRTTGSCSCF